VVQYEPVFTAGPGSGVGVLLICDPVFTAGPGSGGGCTADM